MNKKHIEKRGIRTYNGTYRRRYSLINIRFMKGGVQKHFYFFRMKGKNSFLSK